MAAYSGYIEAKIQGNRIALFEFYGWGDGEWMRTWESDCEDAGANLVCDYVICQETPDAEIETACMELGKRLSK